jgi:hypothetical protein
MVDSLHRIAHSEHSAVPPDAPPLTGCPTATGGGDRCRDASNDGQERWHW